MFDQDLQFGQTPYRALSQQANPFGSTPDPQSQALGNVLGTGGATVGAAAFPGAPTAPSPLNQAPTMGAMPFGGASGAPSPWGQMAGMGGALAGMMHPGMNAIQSAYQQYLGRQASPMDVMSHFGGNGQPDFGQIQHVVNTIAGSPEAKLYAARQKALKGATSDAGTQMTPTPPGPVTGSGSPSPVAIDPATGAPNGGGPVTGSGSPNSALTPALAGAGQVGPVPNPNVLMGFDMSRFNDPAAMQTDKYYVGQLLSAGMDPAAAAAAAKAKGLNVTYDAQNQNLMLNDNGGDGYIGLRPADRNDPNSGNVWQWMAYNNDVRAPDGSTGANMAPGGGAAAPGASSPLMSYAMQQPNLLPNNVPASMAPQFTNSVLQALMQQLAMQGALG